VTVLDEIAAFLQDQGLGVVQVDLFTGTLPNDPPVCGSVQEYPAVPPEFGFGFAGVNFETPGVQVLFRGEPHDYAGPRAKAEAAYRALSAVSAQPLSGTFYHHIHPQHSPFPLGRDDDQRVMIVCSYLCEKEPSA
jgi:hypothetical protein